MNDTGLRAQLLATARAMNERGLNQGTSGNISVRVDDGYLITPTALAYDQCAPEDVVCMDWQGEARGRRNPSSEWRIHQDIYLRFPQAGAILHAHCPHATALACLKRPIPAFHYMVAMAGGDSIPCAPYATFGTQALSDRVLESLAHRSATLMAHHGMVCHADNLDRALALAIEVENLARMYLALLPVAEPPLLPAAEMAEILERFKQYKS